MGINFQGVSSFMALLALQNFARNVKRYAQVPPSPNNTYTQLALQIPQQALRTANFPSALPWPAAPHGYDIVRNCKGGQRGGSGAYNCRARVIAPHRDAAASFANCNPDAQRACRPRRRFRFLCRCCACVAHNPCRMCGTNSFIGPTQLAVFHAHIAL